LVVDTQNEKPRHRIQLDKVGVKDLKTFLITERSGLRHHLIPRVDDRYEGFLHRFIVKSNSSQQGTMDGPLNPLEDFGAPMSGPRIHGDRDRY